jgi:hypothetical protein
MSLSYIKISLVEAILAYFIPTEINEKGLWDHRMLSVGPHSAFNHFAGFHGSRYKQYDTEYNQAPSF